LRGQQTAPYSGQSAPPPDDTIETSEPQQPQPLPKPRAGKPMDAQPAAPSTAPAPQTYVDPAAGTDAGIVQPVQPQPSATSRHLVDPDGDIVHPEPLPPGVIGEGTTIRVRLVDQLSTRDAKRGDRFRTKVASDVSEGGQVLIPMGSEIEGRVVAASSGAHLGSRGSMALRPETVILPNGTRFQLQAYLFGAPGAHAKVNSEGMIGAEARIKRGAIEYGGAMGAGAIVGAALGGGPGALAGTLIGAGAVTVHLLVSHPQAILEPGTVLLFTLTQPLNMVAMQNTNSASNPAPAERPAN
jgi:hypothetical protein